MSSNVDDYFSDEEPLSEGLDENESVDYSDEEQNYLDGHGAQDQTQGVVLTSEERTTQSSEDVSEEVRQEEEKPKGEE